MSHLKPNFNRVPVDFRTVYTNPHGRRKFRTTLGITNRCASPDLRAMVRERVLPRRATSSLGLLTRSDGALSLPPIAPSRYDFNHFARMNESFSHPVDLEATVSTKHSSSAISHSSNPPSFTRSFQTRHLPPDTFSFPAICTQTFKHPSSFLELDPSFQHPARRPQTGFSFRQTSFGASSPSLPVVFTGKRHPPISPTHQHPTQTDRPNTSSSSNQSKPTIITPQHTSPSRRRRLSLSPSLNCPSSPLPALETEEDKVISEDHFPPAPSLPPRTPPPRTPPPPLTLASTSSPLSPPAVAVSTSFPSSSSSFSEIPLPSTPVKSHSVPTSKQLISSPYLHQGAVSAKIIPSGVTGKQLLSPLKTVPKAISIPNVFGPPSTLSAPPTRFGRTIYSDTRHVTIPAPNSSHFASPEIQFWKRQRDSRSLVDEDITQLKQLRNKNRVEKRRAAEIRIMKTYEKEHAKVVMRENNRIEFCKRQRAVYEKNMATPTDDL